MTVDANAPIGPITLRAHGGAMIPVRRLDLSLSVDGPDVRSVTTAVFHNEQDLALEADLVVPLPPFASVRGLSVRWGQRSLQCAVAPRGEARDRYARAAEEGAAAALAEGEGEDLVRVRIAPVAPGDDVEVSLTLLHPALATLEGHRVVVPLTYMPRYIEGPGALSETESASHRPRPVSAMSRADVEVAVRGVSPERVRCVSHRTQVAHRGEVTVLRVEEAPLDRDVVIDVLDRETVGGPTMRVRRTDGPGPDGLGPCVQVTVSPPSFADEGPARPRAVVFLVDRSGSMEGRPMEAAKRAVRGSLRALGPNDRFNLVAFDDQMEALALAPLPFNDATLAAADRFALSLTARGGTEASQALRAVLGDPLPRMPVAWKGGVDPDAVGRLRLVVLMTDGDVSGAAAVLAAAREALRGTRLHVLGIGDAVDHALLAELAELGGGTYTPVASDEDLERAIHALKTNLDAPLWTSVEATLLRRGAEQPLPALEPAGRWDLYAARPFTLAWRGDGEPGDALLLRGLGPDGRDLTITVPLDEAPLTDDGHARWASMRARRLTYRFRSEDDAALSSLGVQFGLITRCTALVGVDSSAPAERAHVSVSVSFPMPRNTAEELSFGGIGAAMAAMAPRVRAGGGGSARVSPLKKRAKKLLAAFLPPPPADEVESSASFDATPAEEFLAPAPAAQMAREPESDDAALRALLLTQRADGLFGDVPQTLAAVAALVSRGHTHRQGGFRAELKRTLAALRGVAARGSGVEATWACIAVALLTVPHGDAPQGLVPPLDGLARGVSLGDAISLRQSVIALMNAAPGGWDAGAAGATRARFLR